MTGVQTCALPIFSCAKFLPPRRKYILSDSSVDPSIALWHPLYIEDRKSVVEGERVDVGEGRMIKNKKKKINTLLYLNLWGHLMRMFARVEY